MVCHNAGAPVKKSSSNIFGPAERVFLKTSPAPRLQSAQNARIIFAKLLQFSIFVLLMGCQEFSAREGGAALPSNIHKINREDYVAKD